MLPLIENIKKEIVGIVHMKWYNDFFFVIRNNKTYYYVKDMSLFLINQTPPCSKYTMVLFEDGVTLYDIDKVREDYFHDQMNGAIFGFEPKDIVKETKIKILESLSYKTKNGTKIDY